MLARPATDLRVAMLGQFRVVAHESELTLSGGSQRLLAFLALKSCWVKRALVAGTLWPDSSDGRAHASLRSALSRMEQTIRESVEITPAQLRLAQHVAVDLARSRALALRLLNPTDAASDADISPASITSLSSDLLPDWYDDWVLLEIEDWRQLRLHALESLAGRLIARRLFADAARAAIAAVRADPLRESPHAMLMRVHLAEGNRSEALRIYRRFRDLLQSELGIPPSPAVSALVDGIERLQASPVTRR